jgi:response regulator RpfG family c-di-GMP phosphodiesterase
MTETAISELPRILIVDDEPNVLDGLRRQLRRDFATEAAVGGVEGLTALESEKRFAVVVSDFRMPGMNGAEFLAVARAAAPETTRMLLTGQADLEGAAAVVNEGQVFRLLLKPISGDALTAALHAAVDHHKVVVSERELLEQTLRGSVKALVDVLALANPVMFARTARVRRLITDLLDLLPVPDRWTIDVAAALCELGTVSLPHSVSVKLQHGEELTPKEQSMVTRLPEVAVKLLADIPRLDAVRDAIRYSRKNYDGSGPPEEDVEGEALPLGARILRVARDLDALVTEENLDEEEALVMLGQRRGHYDPRVLRWLAPVLAEQGKHKRKKELAIAELKPGMVLARDVTTRTGLTLISHGHEVTEGLLARIQNFAEMDAGVAEPVAVLIPARG